MKSFKKFRAAHLRLGRAGERAARQLLRAKNCDIVGRNWRTRSGEIDILACDGATLVFVEVKTMHRTGRLFRPGSNYRISQMRRNVRAARQYLRELEAPDLSCRFDLIEVVIRNRILKEIRHHYSVIPTRFLKVREGVYEP